VPVPMIADVLRALTGVGVIPRLAAAPSPTSSGAGGGSAGGGAGNGASLDSAGYSISAVCDGRVAALIYDDPANNRSWEQQVQSISLAGVQAAAAAASHKDSSEMVDASERERDAGGSGDKEGATGAGDEGISLSIPQHLLEAAAPGASQDIFTPSLASSTAAIGAAHVRGRQRRSSSVASAGAGAGHTATGNEAIGFVVATANTVDSIAVPTPAAPYSIAESASPLRKQQPTMLRLPSVGSIHTPSKTKPGKEGGALKLTSTDALPVAAAPAAYAAWRARKADALASVLSHMEAFGGVGTAASDASDAPSIPFSLASHVMSRIASGERPETAVAAHSVHTTMGRTQSGYGFVAESGGYSASGSGGGGGSGDRGAGSSALAGTAPLNDGRLQVVRQSGDAHTPGRTSNTGGAPRRSALQGVLVDIG
jgi:hypothetical protein